ncbi:UNVERIFIED_CONTAM: DNA invertase Pin-like site-specific DNA recombinase [Acetivibrio alkalicellulosi]
MKTRIVAYCRVSTDKQDQKNSFEGQKKYFEQYIKSNEEWELINVYADKGITGTNVEKREQFKKMIEDAKREKFDLILTKEVSRFARNTVDTLNYTRQLKKLDIGVIFTTDNINTLDNEGELRLSLMATLAQEESRKISERVKWGQQRRMEHGAVFGRELLGYNLHKGELSINKEESQIVRLIFHKYLREGKGTHVIARELYEDGISTKRGNRWSNTTILKILKNEKYVGDLCQKKTFTLDYLDHKKQYNKGEEELIYIKDHHEPIIDRKTWDETQKELQKRTTTEEQKSKYSNRYWCSGKIVCGLCNNKFISRSKKLKSGQMYKAWRCFEAANHGRKKFDSQGNKIGCNNSSLNHVVLGMIVNTVLKALNSNKETIIDELMESIRKLNKPVKPKNINTLNKKIDSINIKKQKIIDNMIEGIISKDDLKMMNKKYDNEIEAIQKEITRIKEVDLVNQRQADNLQTYIKRVKELVNQLNNDNIEEIYKKVADKIIVYPDNMLELYLNCIPNSIKLKYTSKGKNGIYDVNVEMIQEVSL